LTDLVPGRVDLDGDDVEVRTRVVLDTSVLIGDPGCLGTFAGVDVVIPFTVIEELDGLKTRPDDVGRAARSALRTIEGMVPGADAWPEGCRFLNRCPLATDRCRETPELVPVRQPGHRAACWHTDRVAGIG